MSTNVVISEKDINQLDQTMLEILLIDRSRPKKGKKPQNIIWATDNHDSFGSQYNENEQITIKAIAVDHGSIIQPRVRKTKEEQQSRSRDKGETYTLAKFTAKFMPRNKRSVSGVCQGPKYFSKDGMSLYQIKETFLQGKK